MKNKIIAMFIIGVFVLSILSVSAFAFGELETNEHQTVYKDFWKSIFEGGFFGKMYSLTPSGCNEKYEASVTSIKHTQSSYPMQIDCIGARVGVGGTTGSDYYCKVKITFYRSTGQQGVSKTYELPAMSSMTEYWVTNGYPDVTANTYQLQYYSWTCPVTPICEPHSIHVPICDDGARGWGYVKCKSDGSGTTIMSGVCQTGYKCKIESQTSAPICILDIPVCTPNWQCGIWDVCKSNSQQTRTCSDGCGNTKTETQSCNYQTDPIDPVCSPITYDCGSWSSCVNSKQERICTIDTCGATKIETQICEEYANCPKYEVQQPCSLDEKKVVITPTTLDKDDCYVPEIFKCVDKDKEEEFDIMDYKEIIIGSVAGIILIISVVMLTRKKKRK